jgi:hypothetical protein
MSVCVQTPLWRCAVSMSVCVQTSLWRCAVFMSVLSTELTVEMRSICVSLNTDSTMEVRSIYVSVYRTHCGGAQFLCWSVYRPHCGGAQSLSVEHKTLLTPGRSCRRTVWCIHGTGRNNVNSHSPRGMCRPIPTETDHDRLMHTEHTAINVQYS